MHCWWATNAASMPTELNVAFVLWRRYRYGPQPADFDGQRALDFVLDNNTLNDTNRT